MKAVIHLMGHSISVLGISRDSAYATVVIDDDPFRSKVSAVDIGVIGADAVSEIVGISAASVVGLLRDRSIPGYRGKVNRQPYFIRSEIEQWYCGLSVLPQTAYEVPNRRSDLRGYRVYRGHLISIIRSVEDIVSILEQYGDDYSISRSDISALTGISKQSVRDLTRHRNGGRSGSLAFARIGDEYRVRKDGFIEWLRMMVEQDRIRVVVDND